MDAAWESGITTFDTADAYGGGRSERFIGEWLRAKGPEVRQEIVLSTKTFNPMAQGADHGLAPARVRRQLESSLDRLGVERVDMFLAHAWDPDVPVAETAGALDELVTEGKVGAYGLSNVDGTELREALGLEAPTAEPSAPGRKSLPPPAAAGSFGWVQNSYSLLDREAEREVLPLCAERGLGFTPFSPLAGGWLTGKYRRGEPPPAGSRMTTRPEAYRHLVQDERVYDVLESLEAAAAKRGTTPAALALAWLLSDPRVSAVVVGPRRPEHLGPPLEAAGVALDDAARAALSSPWQ